jgi:ElaA protein
MLQWTLKKFPDLTPHELYKILQLRNSVFVVEQQCAYQDADNKDLYSFHLMGFEKDHLAAYTRLLPPGISYPEASIGRVVTSGEVRRKGMGKLLMEQSIRCITELFGKGPIRIGAQLYLQDFYKAFGFHPYGEIYLEDGIEHIEMMRP